MNPTPEIGKSPQKPSRPLLKLALLLSLFAGVQQAATQETLWNQLAAQHQVLAGEQRWVEAENMAEGMAWYAARTWDKTHPNYIDSLERRARSLKQQGELGRAPEAYHELLNLQEKSLGGEDPKVQATLYDLAEVYASVGRADWARPLVKRLMEHPAEASSEARLSRLVGHVASLYAEQRRWEEAEGLYQDLLGHWRAAYGEHHRTVADVQQRLAALYAREDRRVEAERLWRESLAIRRLDATDVSASAASIALGRFYEGLGDEAQAQVYYRDALSAFEGEFETATPEGEQDWRGIVETLERRASIYANLAMHAEALRTYSQALDLVEARLGPDHLRAAALMESMAGSLRAMNMDARANSLEHRARSIRLGR